MSTDKRPVEGSILTTQIEGRVELFTIAEVSEDEGELWVRVETMGGNHVSGSGTGSSR